MKVNSQMLNDKRIFNSQFCILHSLVPTDILTITDLELWTHIGVSEEERATEQRLLVTIEMSFDATLAAKSDDVKLAVNYFDVANDLRELAMEERKTIEHIAEDAAQMVLKNYKTSAVTVIIKKFALPSAENVQIQITRTTHKQ